MAGIKAARVLVPIEIGKLYRTRRVMICMITDGKGKAAFGSAYLGSKKLVLVVSHHLQEHVVALYKERFWVIPRKNLRVAYKQQ